MEIENPPITGIGALPCPFCGTEEVSLSYKGRGGASGNYLFVRCRRCDSSGPSFYYSYTPDTVQVLNVETKVIAAWNTRFKKDEK